ncbi:MAG: prepilin-type N-terminal cleavage/methylation domain-containing protein [bacterium]
MIMRTRGFTLVEFIMVIAATSAVALMGWVLFGPVDNWMFTQYRRAGFAENAAAVSRIQKEIRRIKAPGQIQIFTATQLRFVDIDNNTVDFLLSGTDLMRGADVLARNVQGLTFTYLDKDGNATAVQGQIRVIKVKLAIASGNQTIRIESSERIRNLP